MLSFLQNSVFLQSALLETPLSWSNLDGFTYQTTGVLAFHFPALPPCLCSLLNLIFYACLVVILALLMHSLKSFPLRGSLGSQFSQSFCDLNVCFSSHFECSQVVEGPHFEHQGSRRWSQYCLFFRASFKIYLIFFFITPQVFLRCWVILDFLFICKVKQ